MSNAEHHIHYVRNQHDVSSYKRDRMNNFKAYTCHLVYGSEVKRTKMSWSSSSDEIYKKFIQTFGGKLSGKMATWKTEKEMSGKYWDECCGNRLCRWRAKGEWNWLMFLSCGGRCSAIGLAARNGKFSLNKDGTLSVRGSNSDNLDMLPQTYCTVDSITIHCTFCNCNFHLNCTI